MAWRSSCEPALRSRTRPYRRPGAIRRATGHYPIARLAIDTGAPITLVSARLLESLGYDTDSTTRQQPISMASGVAFAPYITISRLAALGQERRDFLVLAHTLPPTYSVDGLLGLDFLRGQHLLIDFRLGLVLLD